MFGTVDYVCAQHLPICYVCMSVICAYLLCVHVCYVCISVMCACLLCVHVCYRISSITTRPPCDLSCEPAVTLLILVQKKWPNVMACYTLVSWALRAMASFE